MRWWYFVTQAHSLLQVIEALDNSPTYRRTNADLERIMAIAGNQPKADTIEQPEEAVVEESETTDNYNNTETNG